MAVNPLEYLGSGGSALDYRGGMGGQGEDEFNQLRKGQQQAGVTRSDALVMQDERPRSPVTQQSPGISVDPNKNTPVPQTPTFAQLRNNNMPRPAPPPAAPVVRAARPTLAPAADAQPVRSEVLAAARQLLAQPSGYGSREMQDQLERFNANLDAEAKQGFRQVNEGLASRGFFDGTEAARALGSYSAALDRQRRDFAGNLAIDAAQRQTADRANALQSAYAVLNGLQGQDVTAAEFAERQRQFDDNFAQSEQDAALRREQVLRSLGIQEDQTYANINSDERRQLMDLLDKLGTSRITGLGG